MTSGNLPANLKRTSALRRVKLVEEIRIQSENASEGDVCAFELLRASGSITVEAPSGRLMAIAPGEIFLATPGERESTRWASGRIPVGGLVPEGEYWVIADCGLVGELFGDPPSNYGYLGRVRYLGTVRGTRGETLNLRQFAVVSSTKPIRKIPVYLLLGTSGDSGKTTAGVAVLRALRMQGYGRVLVLKATGTSSVIEIAKYQDFGAAYAFDCVDFGLPTTYPSGRAGITDFFGKALDFCFSSQVDALLIECGGDLFGANVPEFLACVKERCPDCKVVLAAADVLGALGATRVLAEMGLSVSLITGSCTDTPTVRERTEALCGVPAVNLLRSSGEAGTPI